MRQGSLGGTAARTHLFPQSQPRTRLHSKREAGSSQHDQQLVRSAHRLSYLRVAARHVLFVDASSTDANHRRSVHCPSHSRRLSSCLAAHATLLGAATSKSEQRRIVGARHDCAVAVAETTATRRAPIGAESRRSHAAATAPTKRTSFDELVDGRRQFRYRIHGNRQFEGIRFGW